MATATRKTELSPLEAIVVENTLGEEARRDTQEGALARIQRLTRERQQLYRFSAAHPFLASANGPRIRRSLRKSRVYGRPSGGSELAPHGY